MFSLDLLKAKEVKPVVETDISRAAKGFAEDATNIKYRWNRKSSVADGFIPSPSSWRNEKATFKEKLVEIATEKVNLLSNCVYAQKKIMHFW